MKANKTIENCTHPDCECLDYCKAADPYSQEAEKINRRIDHYTSKDWKDKMIQDQGTDYDNPFPNRPKSTGCCDSWRDSALPKDQHFKPEK